MADDNPSTTVSAPTAAQEFDQAAESIRASLAAGEAGGASQQVFNYVDKFVKALGSISATGSESGDEKVYGQEIVASLNELSPGFGDQQQQQVQNILNGLISGYYGISEDPSKQNIHTRADPIMMFNGQFVQQTDDVRIDGAGITFLLRRTYKNQVVYVGPFGANWDHSYNIRLRIAGTQLILTTGDLRQLTYSPHPQFGQAGFSYFVPPDGEHSVILPNGASYLRRSTDGTRHVFEVDPAFLSVHRLKRIEDRYGNFLEFAYVDAMIRRVFLNHLNRIVQFHYDTARRITSVEDFTGRTWRYTYDDYGDLIGFTTPATDRYKSGLTTCYEYTPSSMAGLLGHNLVRIADPNGRTYLENEFGTASGTTSFNRVVRQRQATGEALFEYELIDPVFEHTYTDSQRPAFQTNYIDRNGHPIHFIYNKFGNLILREEAITDGPRRRLLRRHYRYNADGALIANLSPEGVLTQYLFGRDFFQRSHGVSDPDVATNPSLTMDERLAFGNRLALVRRGRHQTISALQLAQGVWGDIFPDILGALDASDAVSKFTYESTYGQPLTSSDPRFTERADPNHPEPPSYASGLTKYTYSGPAGDNTRLLSKVTHPLPTWPDGTQPGAVVEQFTSYDQNGRLLESIDPVGISTTYRYFPPGDPLFRDGFLQRRVVDPLGLANTTEFEVDTLGRLTAVHNPRSAGATPGEFVTQQRYNELDQLIRIESSAPFNFITRRNYDRSSQLEREEREATDQSGAAVPGAPEVRTFRYNEDLNLVRETVGGEDLGGHLVVRHGYGASGQLALTRLAAGNAIRFRYDERLLPIARITGAGTPDAATTRKKYDADGRLASVLDGRANRTDFRLDSFGRTIAETDPGGNVTRRDYDKANNLLVERVFERRADGSFVLLARTEKSYDSLNRCVRDSSNLFPAPIPAQDLDTDHLASPGPGRLLTTQFFFDAKNRQVTIVDRIGRKRAMIYDSLDRVHEQVDPGGNRITYSYDANGNLVRSDAKESVVEPLTGLVLRVQVFTRTQAFDQLDRLISSSDSLGNTTRYSYDSRGHRVVRIDPLDNVERYTFDIFGRRVERVQEMTATGLGGGPMLPSIVTRFEYDPNGNLSGTVDPLGRHTSQTFDALDRRRHLVFPDGGTISFDYDADGHVVAATDPNGAVRRCQIDQLGRTRRVDVDRTQLVPGVQVEGTDLQVFEWDALGRCRHSESSFASCDLQFDSLGRAIQETSVFTTPAAPFAQALDLRREFSDAGALVRLVYPAGLDVRYHRAALDEALRIEQVALGQNYPGSAAAAIPSDIALFEYEGRHRSRAVFANGAETIWRHDGARRPIEIAHLIGGQSFLTIQQLFDGAGNMRVRNDFTTAGTEGEVFRFDSAGRLTFASRVPKAQLFAAPVFAPSSHVPPDPLPDRQAAIDALIALSPQPNPAAFIYDSCGNREMEQPTGQPGIVYTTNDLDQYTDVAGAPLQYDKNGNLLDDGSKEYNYDAFDRLVRVLDKTTGADIARFFHDAQGRRILEITGGTTTHFVFNGLHPIAEYRAGLPFAEYIFDDGLDHPIQIAVDASDKSYHADVVGSIRRLIDHTGNIAAQYSYNAFGVPADVGGSYNPIRYAGRRFDGALGSYDYRSRQYDPLLGRFLQRDPGGMTNGTNVYLYSANNPLTFSDPLGTERRSSLPDQISTNVSMGHLGTNPEQPASDVAASLPAFAQRAAANAFGNLDLATGVPLSGPLNLWSTDIGHALALSSTGYTEQQTTLYLQGVTRWNSNVPFEQAWGDTSAELAFGEGISLGSIRSYGLELHPQPLGTVHWRREIPGFRSGAGVAGGLLALGGLAFLYSATQQTDPTRRITEEVIGGGQFVAGVGYILAAVPKPPVPPAIVISPLRTATAQIFGGAARIFGAAGITYSIASALADLTELTQIANIQRDAMTDSERAAADERSRQESEFYKTLRSPARH